MTTMTNSALVWKRMADESQQSAKIFARVSVGLTVILLGVGAYAVSTQSRYADLCTTITANSDHAAAAPARELGLSIASIYCN